MCKRYGVWGCEAEAREALLVRGGWKEVEWDHCIRVASAAYPGGGSWSRTHKVLNCSVLFAQERGLCRARGVCGVEGSGGGGCLLALFGSTCLSPCVCASLLFLRRFHLCFVVFFPLSLALSFSFFFFCHQTPFFAAETTSLRRGGALFCRRCYVWCRHSVFVGCSRALPVLLPQGGWWWGSEVR